MTYKYDRTESMIAQADDEELDFWLELSRKMKFQAIEDYENAKTPERKELYWNVYRTWYHTWDCCLIEIKRRREDLFRRKRI